MKLILTENQLRLIISNSIIEQKETESSTDARTVSHMYLTDNYGLPQGANHENYLYSANTNDIINKIGSFEEKTKLSMFKPYKPYGENKKDYMDYFSLGGEELKPSPNKIVEKQFNLIPNSTIIASHNGLLSLTRAMDGLENNTDLLKIVFGKEKDVKSGTKERYVRTTIYNSTKALNQSPSIKSILMLLTVASINRNEYTLKFVKSQKKELTFNINELKSIIQNITNNLIQGFYGFLPIKNNDEKSIQENKIKINKLKEKGYIYNIDTSEIFNQMFALQKEYDILNNAINNNKKKLLKDASNNLLPEFIEKIKNAYINNFNIFVNEYLIDLKSKILPTINSTKFDYINFDELQEMIFNKSITGGSIQNSTDLNIQQSYYEK